MKKIIISIPKEGKEFTTRELITKFGSQEIKEKLKTNGLQSCYIKKTVERLEANGCSCVTETSNIVYGRKPGFQLENYKVTNE